MLKLSAAISLSLTLLAGPALAQPPIALGTNPQGSLAYATGSAIANVVGQSIDRNVVVVPLGGPSAIIPAMVDGEFDFSFANITAAAQAYTGTGSFEGRPYEGLRVATAIYPLKLGIIATKDSGATRVADLAGKRVASEFTSQRNLSVFMSSTLTLAGMSYEDVKPVPVQNGVQALDELIDGSLDATIFSVSAGKVAQADAAVGIRFLDFPINDETKAAIAEMAPGATVAKDDLGREEAGPEGSSIIEAFFVILVTKDTDDETVYEVVSGIANEIAEIAKADPQFATLTVEAMAQPSLPIPYHPGAIRFFEEQGVWK